jgi:hypothetical protein
MDRGMEDRFLGFRVQPILVHFTSFSGYRDMYKAHTVIFNSDVATSVEMNDIGRYSSRILKEHGNYRSESRECASTVPKT